MTTNDDTSPRAGLDLDAITKRARRVYPKRGWDGGEAERALPVVTEDVPALVARVRDLTAKFDAAAQAYDDILAQVWRATGETHEPPADVAALTDRVDALRCEAESLTRRLAGRDETNANLLGRLIAAENAVAAARREGAEAMREACAKTCDRAAASLDAGAADDCDPDDPDTAADYGRFTEAVDLAGAIRAIPLPGGEP